MFERTCPKCEKILTYETKPSLNRAIRNNSKCFKCCNLNQHISQETRDKISKTLTGKPSTSSTKFKKGDNVGEKSPMFGKSTQICLIEKYGEKDGNIRYKQVKEKLKKRFSGKNNPFYGKINKQGNGYSGWYKNWFFRSITELSYVIKLESEGKSWVSAENLGFHIEYIGEKGTDRTYRPDFLVENKYLVEIKPLKLQTSKMCLSKSKAAEEFCKKHNYEYILTDCKKIEIDLLKSMYDNKIIKFTEKTEKKFIKYYNQYIKKAVRNLHP